MNPETNRLPCLPLRDMIFFPHMVSPVFVGRSAPLATVESMPPDTRRIFLVAQKDARAEEPGEDGLFGVGTEAEVLQLMRLRDGTVKILLEGVGRRRALAFETDGHCFWARVAPLAERLENPARTSARCRALLDQFEDYLRVNQRVPHEVFAAVEGMETPSAMADAIAASLPLKMIDKQRLLETLDVEERITDLSGLLEGEIELLKLERKVRGRVRRQMDRSQKEFYLTEQLRAIQQELGQPDSLFGEGEELREKAKKAHMPKEILERVEKEIKRLEMMTPLSAEASVVRNYIEWLIDVPWSERTRDRNDLAAAREVLDRDHYGLRKVKERILEHLAVKILNKSVRGPILCFVGPPGVGKTSLGRSIASAMRRRFIRVSLGGVRDEAEIRGHRRTYIGALPGRIIQSMKKAGTRNPVFMLDEVDKMNADFRGDPASALLEVLDPEQNKNFSDHFLEVDYDLSRVFFIATANTTDAIPAPLIDRMEIIRIPGYIDEEKLEIAKRFLLPRQRSENGLREDQLEVEDGAIARLIHEYTREAGVRSLERELGNLCRKVARRIVEERSARRGPKAKKRAGGAVRVDAEAVETFLGPRRYLPDRPETRAGVGVATGLAWTSAGGVLLPVEVSVFEGKGAVTLTGKLGEVMKESASAGISWIRSRTKELGVSPDFFEKRDVHIHIPEGAIPKDGPSAGITMAIALTSALTGRKVRHDVAMTGEVTLRGRVLAVGGVKEKLLAARRGEIPNVILPRDNEKDVQEVESEGPIGVRVIFVETMDEVVREGFVPPRKARAAGGARAALRGRPARIRRAAAGKRRAGAAAKVPPAAGKKGSARGRRPGPPGR